MGRSSLILAVEPDAGQSAQLGALLERQFDAEVILTPTAAAALSRLAGRVPDLVLTSPLIPPRDEASLVNWLRGLGTVAAHVQNVTIPVLAGPETSSPRRQGASALARGRASAPDSCDPAVFADWVAVYLELASAHRTSGGSPS